MAKSDLFRRHPALRSVEASTVEELLGYLNYSNGTPDPRFQRGFNALYGPLFEEPACAEPRNVLTTVLCQELDRLEGTAAAFGDVSQARAVIGLALQQGVEAYRRHHSDLLFHLPPRDFEHPFFLVRLIEAVLAQGPPWSEEERIVSAAVDGLNDFVGFRPVAVLENDRQMQPYEHEAFRPVPLYLAGAGIAHGPYHDLLQRAWQLFEEVPTELQQEAHFHREHVDELALDVRAYDHLHPVNKRTNYIFGEWDPRVIDTRGFYRRFVVRKMILDALLRWIAEDLTGSGIEREERLFDAAAVLCGTILMASAISGSGPGTHDSTVSLTALLPKVARQRDRFYARLLEQARGERARRLERIVQQTQQPFGHVRQHLNMELSRLGARQVDDRFLAQFFARLGYPEASRQQAARIPCPAARFEAEIGWRLTAAVRCVERGNPQQAGRLLRETRDLLFRGIDCGALVDPWNILGFQGQFPLFHSREDSVPDQRVELLLQFLEQFFDAAGRAMCEAAAAGDGQLAGELSALFQSVAEWWDRFATTTVSDLPRVHGGEAWESACCVAEAIAQWRQAGEAAGDISFWRQHVDRFQSAQAYGRVVETLLQKGDPIGAQALLMQWLSQAEEVGLESGGYSFNTLLKQWVGLVTGAGSHPAFSGDDLTAGFRRLFDYLEANAGDYWSVPSFGETGTTGSSAVGESPPLEDDRLWEEETWAGSEESELFEAAYEDVVYRDSAADGHVGDMLDGDFAPRDTEIESITRHLEPRLDFLRTLAELWREAAETLGSRLQTLHRPAADQSDADRSAVLGWIQQVRTIRRGLAGLIHDIAEYTVPPPSGNADSNFEFDIQMQARYFLLHKTVAVAALFRLAEWFLRALLDERGFREANIPPTSRRFSLFLRHVLQGDVVSIRRELPAIIQSLSKQPLLYVAVENGGDPQRFLTARSMQLLLSFLLQKLPQHGLLNETRQLLWTAYRMERFSRPAGVATTEFDRLLRTALVGSVQAVVSSARHWPIPSRRRGMPDGRRRGAARRSGISSPEMRETVRKPAGGPFRLPPAPQNAAADSRSASFRSARSRRGRTTGSAVGPVRRRSLQTARRAAQRRPRAAGPALQRSRRKNRLPFAGGSSVRQRHELLLSLVQVVVERYETLWLKHSRSVRLSPVELLQDEERWERVKNFISRYGDDLLHAPMLMLSNIRAILHQGVDEFLNFLQREEDPLHPVALLADIEAGRISREEACDVLELVYEAILDKLDRFIEYNTTTTQSDYGSQFYCLLDFLRVESEYDREAWNLRPYRMAHEVLAEAGSPALARLWQQKVADKTATRADAHLKKLAELQSRYSVRLPSVEDHLSERFVKAMAVDRMRALIAPAWQESFLNEGPNEGQHATVQLLQQEIERYLRSTTGSAIEVPEWLQKLEQEISRLEEQSFQVVPAKQSPEPVRSPLRLRQLLRRLAEFDRPRRRGQ